MTAGVLRLPTIGLVLARPVQLMKVNAALAFVLLTWKLRLVPAHPGLSIPAREHET
jgi:hypothetical protein